MTAAQIPSCVTAATAAPTSSPPKNWPMIDWWAAGGDRQELRQSLHDPQHECLRPTHQSCSSRLLVLPAVRRSANDEDGPAFRAGTIAELFGSGLGARRLEPADGYRGVPVSSDKSGEHRRQASCSCLLEGESGTAASAARGCARGVSVCSLRPPVGEGASGPGEKFVVPAGLTVNRASWWGLVDDEKKRAEGRVESEPVDVAGRAGVLLELGSRDGSWPTASRASVAAPGAGCSVCASLVRHAPGVRCCPSGAVGLAGSPALRRVPRRARRWGLLVRAEAGGRRAGPRSDAVGVLGQFFAAARRPVRCECLLSISSSATLSFGATTMVLLILLSADLFR